jgi:hypothetical protein
MCDEPDTSIPGGDAHKRLPLSRSRLGRGALAVIQQQARDDGECAAWASQSTGIDPMAAAAAPPPAAPGAQGERVRGAARGAAGGAAIGAIAGDAGKGAGIGAVAGTMAGGRQARQNKRAYGEEVQSQQAQTLNTYYRAYGACMEGHGYTIK